MYISVCVDRAKGNTKIHSITRSRCAALFNFDAVSSHVVLTAGSPAALCAQ